MRKYALLPFNFITISGHEVLINELGDFIIVPIGTALSIVNHSISDEELYKSLVANYFVTEEILPSILDIYASRLRTKKGFLDDKTSLHIFVLTLRCNQNCTYCQASSQEEMSKHCSMSLEDMTASVQMMFHSPSPHLTMEFQGGEPSLEPGLIKYGIERAEEINIKYKELLKDSVEVLSYSNDEFTCRCKKCNEIFKIHYQRDLCIFFV